ncbi:MAG: patatin-like phospholipase family protein [Deltaproteobacteria bacterium]|nr:patatin-like phospholipase family protein [Deltaproteobacteria bacterium]
MPEAGEYLYAFGVGTKAGLILGGGGITGGMYELGALSAMDDFIVSGRKSGDFDLYVGISAGSIPAAFLANGITVSEMCSAVLGKGDQGLLLRREDIYELSLGGMFRFLGRSLLNSGTAVRHIRKNGQPVTLLNILAVLQQFLPAGFFSNANLERYVARTLSREGRSNDFRATRKPLAIVATEVDTGERWIFGEGGRKDIPISKAIQASTAIPVFFEPVLIEEHYFVDGATERVGHLDLPAAAGADLIVMINPVVPIYNDRSVVCIPTLDGQCRSLTERGVTAIAEQTFRVNSRVKLELGALLFRADHPGTDLLMIEPSPAESSLFLYGSMNFAERVHSLNYGYNSSVYYFIENYDMLRECFARHGMEVSLERLTADRFLQQAVAPAARRRFGLKRQQSPGR